MTELEIQLSSGNLPWHEIEFRTKHFWMFKSNNPVTNNHMVFVPIDRTLDNLLESYKAAYIFGHNGYSQEKWHNFTINQIVGSHNIHDYPYVELITE